MTRTVRGAPGPSDTPDDHRYDEGPGTAPPGMLPAPGTSPGFSPGTPTEHVVHAGDARRLDWIPDASVHLVVTSPPYFNLKTYNVHPDQVGAILDYEHFLDELDRVWAHCLRALVPGGRVACVAGDVCIARRRNRGRHVVLPLHADIAVRAGEIGFDYLTPIRWNKIANARFEASGPGVGFLGKPYEPNAIIKNDIETILMLRKPGGYRRPTARQRATSRLTRQEHSAWFRPVWTGLAGASTRDHPAPYPVELAQRLIRMFSFTGDTVLDPFLGSGTTTLAAMRISRSSIGVEVDPAYVELAVRRARQELDRLEASPATASLVVR